jgi:hypothetical protein
LQKCRSVYKLQKALASLPKTLDEIYTRILRNITEDDGTNTLKILQWLAYSTRPLQIEEVTEVIAIDIEGGHWFNLEKRFKELRDILTIYSSLITITEKPLYDSNSDDRSNYSYFSELDSSAGVQVRLTYFSVKEYLISERIQAGPAA